MDTRQRRSTTIGLVVPSLDFGEAYNRESWHRIYELSQENQDTLLVLMAGRLGSTLPEQKAANALVRLIPSLGIEGVIVGQDWAARDTQHHRRSIVADFPAVPTVCTTVDLGLGVTVQMDNACGMRDLVRHLITVHNCRQIAHIRGPRGNEEAAIREQVWREELSRAGLAVREEWLVQGDFDPEGLGSLAEDFWGQTQGQVDAVVACNDLAALVLMKSLALRGVRVPEEMRVCGFDDTPICRTHTPSLTSVRQPLDRQIEDAWRILHRMIQGAAVGNLPAVNTELVVRGSCGCPPSYWSEGALSAGEEPCEAGNSWDLQWQFFELTHFLRELSAVKTPARLNTVLNTWLPRLGFHRYALLRTLNNQGELGNCEEVPTQFQVVITEPILDFGQATPCWEALGEWFTAQGSLVVGIYPLITGCAWHGILCLELKPGSGLLERAVQEQVAALFQRLDEEQIALNRLIAEKTWSLVSQEKMETFRRLTSQLAHEINTPLGAISSCQRTLDNKLAEWESEARSFFTQLTPEGHRLYATLMNLLEFPPETPEDRERARSTRRGWTKQLTALQVSEPEELTEELWQIGFASAAIGLDAVVATPGFRAVVHQAALQAGLRQASRIIGEASLKASDRILAMKRASTTPQSSRNERIHLKTSLQSCLDSWGPMPLRHVEIRWTGPETSEVLAREKDLNLVWSHLLKNALQAMNYQGLLELEIREESGVVQVLVTDSGPGISPQVKPRVFQPFVSTKSEGEGMGIGLSVVHQVVESLGGRIGFESRPGRTTFEVTLPRYPFPDSLKQ